MDWRNGGLSLCEVWYSLLVWDNCRSMIVSAPIRVGEDQPPPSWDPIPSPRAVYEASQS
uniref:Uncharacterized protein n=1 Tax=Oryza punctata TaxID=4537 RepID=A0A0E0M7Q8_ORYPU